MQVDLTDLDGRSLGQADLTRSAAGQLMLEAEAVISVRIIGSRTALVLAGKQVCVPTADYARIRYGAASASQDAGRQFAGDRRDVAIGEAGAGE